MPTQTDRIESTPFWINLDRFGSQEALITTDKSLTYRALDRAVKARIAGLKPLTNQRPLVALEMANTSNAIVNYLACLTAGWPVILFEPHRVEASEISTLFQPNLILHANTDRLPENLHQTPQDMHPDLALLMTTSGTTGASKLVRLSRGNIASNAQAIAAYLGVTPDHRAITSLPAHYSYGLSVIQSHLAVGASIILTNDGLNTDAFWQAAHQRQATSMALVPAQVASFSQRHHRPKTLRHVTQAGGKLLAPQAQTLCKLSHREGWDLTIMYGQTEAAPRIAYLPPEHAAHHSDKIGKSIPGGTLWLEDEQGQQITRNNVEGQLIYRGPNVMMGYAETPGDLAKPAGTDILRTGDIAVRDESGFYQITGRKSRFVKPFGLRISLDQIERDLARAGFDAYCTGDDNQINVFTVKPVEDVPQRLARLYNIPASTFRHSLLEHVPKLSSGKIDYVTLAATPIKNTEPQPKVIEVLKSTLGPDIDLDRSFAEHGGSSLAYIDLQLRLSKITAVSEGWENRPLKMLTGQPEHSAIGIDVLLRIAAIAMVVGLHATQWPLAGGTFLLLVLVGYSIARFQTNALLSGNLTQMMDQMLRPFLLGYGVILVATHLLRAPVPLDWFLLIANFDDAPLVKRLQPYWFVSTYAQIVAMIALVFAVPAIRRATSHDPIKTAALALILLLMVAQISGLLETPLGVRHRDPFAAMTFVLLGWMVAHAQTLNGRLIAAIMTALTISVAWSDMPVHIIAMIGVTALLLAAKIQVKLPSPIGRAILRMGTFTLSIYLIHPMLIGPVHSLRLPDAANFALVISLSITASFVIQATMALFFSRKRWRLRKSTA